MKNIKIMCTGIYIPEHCIGWQELVAKMDVSEEVIQKLGMKTHYYANSTAEMLCDSLFKRI